MTTGGALRAFAGRASLWPRALLPVLAACALSLAFAGKAAGQPRAVDFGELEKVVAEELKETKTPGAAVAVVRDGRVVFAKGFGVASVETNDPVTPDTLFRLGSTTKMFTAAALVALAERGRFKLDAPVGDYAKGLAPKLSRLTAHQLLSNTAGVGDFAPPFVSHDDAALARMVRGWKDDDALFAEPGRVYSYSSPGFWLAGYVLEEVTGKPYADAMDELLFAPLGMKRTTLRPLVALTFPLAAGHAPGADGSSAVVRPAFNNVAQWPAGSIYSSANDLSRWAIALMSDGRVGGAQVLPATLFAKLAGRHALMPGDPEVAYGYGLLNFEQRGVRVLMHGGFSRGYGSMLQIVPEQRFAVAVVTNRSGVTLNRTTEKARELLLPLKPATPERPKEKLPLTPADLANFAGRYVNGPQAWEIYAKGGGLFLKFADQEFALEKTGPERLSFGGGLENDLVLVAGEGGRAEYLFTGLYSARRSRAGG